MDIFHQDYLTDAFRTRLERVGGLEGLNNYKTVGEAIYPEGRVNRHKILQQQQREADRTATERAVQEARRQQMLDTHTPGLSGTDHDHSECIRRMRAASLQARVKQ